MSEGEKRGNEKKRFLEGMIVMWNVEVNGGIEIKQLINNLIYNQEKSNIIE